MNYSDFKPKECSAKINEDKETFELKIKGDIGSTELEVTIPRVAIEVKKGKSLDKDSIYYLQVLADTTSDISGDIIATYDLEIEGCEHE